MNGTKKKQTDIRTLKWLYRVPGKKRGVVAALLVAQVVNGFTGVAAALLLQQIVDSAVRGDLTAFWKTVVLIILLVVVEEGLNALIRWLAELGRSSFENVFKLRLMQNILERSYAPVSAVHSGEWMNRLTNDTKVVAEGYVEILPGLAGMAVRLCSAVVMIIVLDPWFALLIAAGGLVLIFTSYVFRRKLKTLHKKMQEADGRVRIFLQERIGSLMMLKSFTAEEKTLEGAAEKMEAHKEARMRKNSFSNICNIGFGVSLYGAFFGGVCYCAYGMLKGTISYGTLAAMMELMNRLQTPVANLTGYLPRFYAMMASAERLMEIEQYPADLQKPRLSAETIRKFYREELESFGLQDADYTYLPAGAAPEGLQKEKMPVVLRRLSLEIRKDSYTAFTGHSGCGKSTVLKLLMCMYPLDGGQTILRRKDGSVFALTASFRGLFAYVPQGNQLMTGTIREVVSFAGAGGADETKVWQALKIACADQFVKELEQGIDTLLGERGTGLSEGQMQRIAIARALYSEAPILLLDESTSALDEKTEEELLHNLRELTDRTVVIVTHRPAALKICDRILLFTEHGIVDNGK